VPSLSDKRLVFVTGKGGVGKSTVAIALGIAAARRGQRTIVVELGGSERAARTFGHPDGAAYAKELALEDNLFTTSIDPHDAMDEYLRRRTGALGDILSSSRAFGAFANATPGMRELLTVGKVWELTQIARRTPGAIPYDLVILDGPATGHGVGLLRTPRTFAEIARVGPIANQGRAIDETISDPSQTGVVAVSLAEEMPVTETIELRGALERELGLPLAGVIANGLAPERIGPRQRRTVEAGLDACGTPAARAALAAALSEHERASAQREQLTRLADGVGRDPHPLPYLFAPVLDRDALEELSSELEPLL